MEEKEMAKYNKSEVMKEAWVLYRSSVDYYTGERNRSFGECLKSAWKNHKACLEVIEEATRIYERDCKPLMDAGYDAYKEFYYNWKVTTYEEMRKDAVNSVGEENRIKSMKCRAAKMAWVIASSNFWTVTLRFGMVVVENAKIEEASTLVKYFV